MNVQEFSKLKTGDKVHNGLTNSAGRVTKTDAGGVYVAWGNSADDQARYFSVQGTSWFHWSVPEPEVIAARKAFVTDRMAEEKGQT